jgi:glycerol kinase
LEAMAFQTRDVIDSIKADTRFTIPLLRVDGGGSANNLLLQFQSDILGIPVERAQIVETTALGAAYLAGIALGFWKDTDEIGQRWKSSAIYEPKMTPDNRETLYNHWQKAVERTRGWAGQEE